MILSILRALYRRKIRRLVKGKSERQAVIALRGHFHGNRVNWLKRAGLVSADECYTNYGPNRLSRPIHPAITLYCARRLAIAHDCNKHHEAIPQPPKPTT